MANKTLFQSLVGALLPRANAINNAGGVAYRLTPQQALAQYAATGCLNGTFYADADNQLATVLHLCEHVEPEFIARTALYSRTEGCMKDMPALLCAVLSVKSPGLMAEIFDRVIDSPKMLRNFVQIMRSGVVGRKSLGSLPKRLILQWLERRTDEQLFIGSIGNDPSLADIIRMVHPRPATPSRTALYGYLIGRACDFDALPEIVRQYERCKRSTDPSRGPVPDVPLQMLTSLHLYRSDWEQIVRNASWQTTRMNLNAFVRHGVFENRELIGVVANRLRNPRLIAQAKVFPYQLLAAYLNSEEAPYQIREALHDAMEIAISNVPHVPGTVYVFPDVSGSMHSPVTGHRKGATSKVRCVDVAALVAAAILRRNPEAVVLPFSDRIVPLQLDHRDTVMSNAKTLAGLPAGGTNCSAPLLELNNRRAKGDLVIYVSDNESWLDTRYRHAWGGAQATQTMKQWNLFKSRSPQAKMVCIDLQPHSTTQAAEREDIINVGGFNDQVFRLINDVARGRFTRDHWVNVIGRTRL